MKPKPNTLRLLARIGEALLAGWRTFFHFGTVFFSLFVALACATNKAAADEGGVSFWVPGLFGSLAAAPQVPGWQFAAINYYTNVSASGTVAAAREIIGKLNPTVNVSANVNLHAQADLAFLIPQYVFATPVFGGQFAVSIIGRCGHQSC